MAWVVSPPWNSLYIFGDILAIDDYVNMIQLLQSGAVPKVWHLFTFPPNILAVLVSNPFEHSTGNARAHNPKC